MDDSFLEVFDGKAKLDEDFTADLIILNIPDTVKLLCRHRFGEHSDQFALFMVEL